MTPWNAYLFCRATGLGRLKSLVTVARTQARGRRPGHAGRADRAASAYSVPAQIAQLIQDRIDLVNAKAGH